MMHSDKAMERGMTIKAGVAGVGAMGGAVCRALAAGKIPGMRLAAFSEKDEEKARRAVSADIPNLDFTALAETCDLVVETLSPDAVPALARAVLARGRTLVMISSAALLRFPEIRTLAEQGAGRLIVPSGALAGIDGVRALASMGMRSATIRSTKKPLAYEGAPFIVESGIDLARIAVPTRLFSGNALEAAKAFPSNVNVAATLGLAGLGQEETRVEVWADPAASGNMHEIEVRGDYSAITARIENMPDPQNPKTSMLAAHSIIACLRQMTEKVSVV